MSTPQKIEKQQVSEVSSLLIPLANRHLLLPTVTVAEMIPYRGAEKAADSPGWYLGDFEWRDQRVPLISYEVICGAAMPLYNTDCRIAVLNNVGVDESLPFLGVATQGIPRLSRVKPEEIREEEELRAERFEFMHVTHAGESVLIPDVAALEQAFIDYRNAQTAG